MTIRTNLTRIFAVCLLGLGMGVSAAAGASINVGSVGVYDADGGANNAVDVEAPDRSVYLAPFKTAVADAYASNLGGVIDFNGYTTSAPAQVDHNETITVAYGIDGSKSLVMTNVSYSPNLIGAGSSNRTAISGEATDLLTTTGSTNPSLVPSQNFKFDLATDSNEIVQTLAMTVISRDGSKGTAALPVHFFLDDGSTFTLEGRAVWDMGRSNAGADAFYSYTAEEGRHIVGFEADIYAANTGLWLALDDIGFVTAIPEPATLALLATGGLALLRRRRR